MNYEIPLPGRHEHDALHDRLRQATQAGGEVGGLAKTLARLMHPHSVKEDQIALPLMGLPAALARGDATPEMAGVLVLTDQRAGLPAISAKHPAIVKALRWLHHAAQNAERRAESATRSSTSEEEMMYPAAILVGRFAPERLGKPMPAAG